MSTLIDSKISARGCRIASSPPDLTRADYASAGTELEKCLADLPGAIAVYSFGSVSAPGVSDIDRLVVLKGPVDMGIAWESLSDSTRVAAMHTPFAMDRISFTDHRWFSHLSGLRCVWGEELQPKTVPDDLYLQRLHAVEGLVLGLLKIRKQLDTGRIKARPTLCTLHGLRFSLDLARIEPNVAPQAWALLDEVETLRGAWFRLPRKKREDRLRQTVSNAPAAMIEALEKIPAREADEVSLSARAFNRVVLTPDPGRQSPVRLIPQTLLSRSRRAGELSWRMRSRRVFVPAGALGWFSSPGGSEQRLWDQREAAISRYDRFIRACGPSASAVGLAQALR